MLPKSIIVFLSLLLRSIVSATQTFNISHPAKPLIIDTDIFSDCDDVGALAVANVLQNCGYADLRGVVVNTQSKWGALAVSAVNAYFGNGDIPIGAMKPLTNETFFDTYRYTLSEFTSKIAQNFPRTLYHPDLTPSPVAQYIALLTSASPASLTLVSIGFLTNLAALLKHPSGLILVRSRVRELVVMGGKYNSTGNGIEFNFSFDAKSTAFVLANWPRDIPITFLGYELGKTLLSGHGLRQRASADSPVLAAYEWYVGRCGSVRESWDPLTVLYAVLGPSPTNSTYATSTPSYSPTDTEISSLFTFANTNGYNSLSLPSGANRWVEDESVTNQHYLAFAENVDREVVSEFLTEMFAFDPRRTPAECPVLEGRDWTRRARR